MLLAAALAAAGCADDESASPATAPPTSSDPESTTQADSETDPLAGAGTDPVDAAPKTDAIALLERVAIGHHDGYDRVVFTFRDEGVPGYRVEYVEPPLREDGSGNVVQLDGSAFLVVRMEPASGFDLTVLEGEAVYTGPRRLAGSDAGASVVREVVRTGDFEAVLTWAVGLGERADFRVLTLESPARLVIDVRN